MNHLSLSSYNSAEPSSLGSVVRGSCAGRSGHYSDYCSNLLGRLGLRRPGLVLIRSTGRSSQAHEGMTVGTCSLLQGDPTGVSSDVNRVLAQDGNNSVNLASQGHCAGVFIGI